MSNYNYLMKFILIGNSGVGKSTLLFQFIENKYKTGIEPTIGIEFGTKIIDVSGKTIRLQIWDSAGQENYRSITRAYYRNTICAVLVYDITNRKSFEDIKIWLEEAKTFGNENMYFVLLGNKAEMENERTVSVHEADTLAKDQGMYFFEVSAVANLNVARSFNIILERILKDIHKNVLDPYNESNGIKIGMNNISKSTFPSLNIKQKESKKPCC